MRLAPLTLLALSTLAPGGAAAAPDAAPDAAPNAALGPAWRLELPRLPPAARAERLPFSLGPSGLERTGLVAAAGEADRAPGAASAAATDPEEDRLTDWFIRPDDPDRWTRFRLELSARGGWLLDARIKKGRYRDASSIDVQHDLHVPELFSPGLRVVLDAKVRPKVVVGAHYTALWFDAPRRFPHADRTFQSVTFAADEQVETRVDVQLAEVFFRYVIRDNPHVRFAVGIGAAWTQLRMRLISPTARARGRVRAWFAPTIGYHVTVRVAARLSLFLESVTAVIAPTRFPSYLSEFRVGFRIPFGPGLELILAGSMQSAWIEDLRDAFGPRPTQNHKMREASWTIVTGDVGLAWRF